MILYTSDNRLRKHLYGNLIATISLVVFGAVYEAFSHGVWSYFMVYSFAVPLLFGVTLYAWMLRRRRYPSGVFLNLWNAAIATLSVGSIFMGVLEIYGTTSSLAVVYPIAGGILIIAALLTLVFRRSGQPPERNYRYDPTN